MKKRLYSLLGAWAAVLMLLPALAQERILVQDSLHDNRYYYDLSLITLWGPHSQAQTAFQHQTITDWEGYTLPAIGMSDQARSFNGFTTANSLKTCNSFDYRFPQVNRYTDTLVLEFDALWDTLIANGEAGRIVCALLYDYPTTRWPDGADLVDTGANHPFGRPVYNIRVLNKLPTVTSGAMYMLYGGGTTPLGEVEMYSSGGQKRWWLPAFMSQPPGVAPGSVNAIYPNSPCSEWGPAVVQKDRWLHFRMAVYPGKVELWVRPSNPALPQTEQRIGYMVTPDISTLGLSQTLARINAGHGTNISQLPTYYNWINRANAARFYFRGGSKAYISSVKIVARGPNTSLPEALAPSRRVWPNPARDILNQEGGFTQPAQLTALDGRSYTLVPNAEGQLVLTGLSAGLYWLQVPGYLGQRVVVE